MKERIPLAVPIKSCLVVPRPDAHSFATRPVSQALYDLELRRLDVGIEAPSELQMILTIAKAQYLQP